MRTRCLWDEERYLLDSAQPLAVAEGAPHRKSESSEICCTSSRSVNPVSNPHCWHSGKRSSLRIQNSAMFSHAWCSARQTPESGTASPLRKASCWASLPVLFCVTLTSPNCKVKGWLAQGESMQMSYHGIQLKTWTVGLPGRRDS